MGPEDPQVPQPPRSLVGEEKKEWNRLAPGLWAKGLLTELDLGTLAMYCDSHGQYCRALAMLKGPIGCCPNCKPSRKKKPEGWEDCRASYHLDTPYGEVMKNRLGKIEKSPYVALKREAEALMTRLAGELGLSASSRSRLPGKKVNQEPPKRNFDPKPPDNDPRKLLDMQIQASKS